MKKSEPTALQEVRQSAQEILATGNADDALEYLLSALGSVLTQNRNLELLVAKLRQERSGKRSERIDPAQLLLLFDELIEQGGDAEASVDPTEESEADAELTRRIDDAKKEEDELNREKKKKRKRRKKVSTRGVQQNHHYPKVPKEERCCESCGREKRLVGEDLTRVLEYVPGHFEENIHHKEKLACGSCKDGVTTAAGPAKVLERSVAGASLLANVVVSKFVDHNPLHRQRRIFRRAGVDVSVSALADWVAGSGKLVLPLAELLGERVLAADVVGTDATGLKVLDPNSPDNIRKGTVWCYAGDYTDLDSSRFFATSSAGQQQFWAPFQVRPFEQEFR